MKEIRSGDYSIYFSKGIAPDLNRFFKASGKKYSSIFILVDENSLKCCYPQLAAKVPAFKDAEIIEIESGEESKTIEVCTQIWSTLSEYGADRKSLFVNLGGGVIGDMGGFIASTFKRGIQFINIPTTLLSQVDASVGGKVAIDLNNLKNEIGLFSTPAAVFIDCSFLNTLPARHILSGYAEMIKHALVADKDFWPLIQNADLSDVGDLEELIMHSVQIKNTIVTADPTEKGQRRILNFGHTIGHALETFSLENGQKQNLLHGEAIAAGMVCEAYLSHKINKLSSADLSTISGFIMNTFAPVMLHKMDHHRLIELMKHDKKNDLGDINFSLLSGIGKCDINKTAKADQIIEALKYYTDHAKLLR
jgi:3-dehydroquinate synthase